VAEAPFDSMTSASGGHLAQGRPSEGKPAEGSSESKAQIKSEIERTRVEMSETIGEIQDRLRPDHLLQQAKDGVTEAAAGKVRNIMSSAGETAHIVADQARGVGSHLSWYVREHPLRVALTVGAVTWWMLRGRQTPRVNWQGVRETSWDYEGESAYPYEGESLTGKVGEYAASARETVGEYAASARDTVGEYADSARTTARRASERVRNVAGTAAAQTQQRFRQASTVTTDWVTENPVAAGAVALAIGMAIGLSAPRTELEDRTMGETRDQAWEKASRVARDLRENVTQKVQTVAETVVADSITGTTATSSSTTPGSSSQGRV
jgi:ElaB/YqjD/DUF883 family membrane-anchored ribosome-binding protein